MARAAKWLTILLMSAGTSGLYACHKSPPISTSPPVSVEISPVPNFPIVQIKDEWNNVTSTDKMQIDIDLKSIKVMVVDDSYRVQTRIRMNFHTPIDITGVDKKGAYYINKMSAACKDDSVYVDESIVYDDAGVELARGTDIGRLRFTKDSDSFIAIWVALSCKDLKGRRPPLST